MTFLATTRLPRTEAERLIDAFDEVVDLASLPRAISEVDAATWRLDIYFETAPDQGALADLAAAVLGHAAEWDVEKLAETDWVALSLEGLRPVAAGGFLVHGKHDRGRALNRRRAIEIEAAQAFGTGHHATTETCLVALAACTKQRTPRRVLDLGTGSGLLAIAAAKLGAAHVLASDIDPLATAAAKGNAAANGAAPRLRAITAAGFRHPAFAAAKPFDLIFANILAKPLVGLSQELVRHAAPGARIILSGLLDAQARMVTARYRAAGCRLTARTKKNGWTTLTLIAPGRPANIRSLGREGGNDLLFVSV
jgi:ribosomal protein L11 methyltransferase